MASESRRPCPACGSETTEGQTACPTCGWDLSQDAPAAPAAPVPVAVEPGPPPSPPPSPPPAAPPAVPAPRAGGRPHSPVVALILALLIPGAGQAYNGRPVRGFFMLFLSPLVLPWFLSVWGAWSTARRMREEGGRFGKGGFVWVFLQFWLFCNVGLATLIVLTIAGVVQ